MIDKIRCFFHLHPYKLIVKLYPADKDLSLPFEAWEQCRVCGQEKNRISGTMGSADTKRIKDYVRGKRRP